MISKTITSNVSTNRVGRNRKTALLIASRDTVCFLGIFAKKTVDFSCIALHPRTPTVHVHTKGVLGIKSKILKLDGRENSRKTSKSSFCTYVRRVVLEISVDKNVLISFSTTVEYDKTKDIGTFSTNVKVKCKTLLLFFFFF